MESIENDLIALASIFINRLSSQYIRDVKEYARFREWGVAFMVLCDQLYEEQVQITQDEWCRIDDLGKRLKIDEAENYNWVILKELVGS